MTTIAYRQGVMAGDRATKYGSITGHETTKVVRREDGALCGACGTTTIAAAFRRWFLAGEDAASKPSLGDDKEDIHAIIARPSGVVEIYDRMGWSVIEGDFHAIGSGTEIALGAMAMGADAAKAVRIAATFGVGDVRSIDVVAALEAPAQPVHPDAELRSVPPATEKESGDQQMFAGVPTWANERWRDDEKLRDFITKESAVFHDGKPLNYAPDTYVDVYFDGDLLRSRFVAEFDWIGFECAYFIHGSANFDAPLIDAQTSEEVDPRVLWKAEPEIPEGFTKWEGGERDIAHIEPVEVLLRNGGRSDTWLAGQWDGHWGWAGTVGDDTDIIAYRIIAAPAPEQDASVEIIVGEPWPEDPTATAIAAYIEAENAEPTPYAEAIEKGAITQDEADFLISERERIAADEQAKFFGQGMMADADRHQSDQRGIVDRLTGMFKSKVDA